MRILVLINMGRQFMRVQSRFTTEFHLTFGALVQASLSLVFVYFGVGFKRPTRHKAFGTCRTLVPFDFEVHPNFMTADIGWT